MTKSNVLNFLYWLHRLGTHKAMIKAREVEAFMLGTKKPRKPRTKRAKQA